MLLKVRTYTADDEFPDCSTCDFICGGIDCGKCCGPEHGWAGYQRTTYKEVEEASKYR